MLAPKILGYADRRSLRAGERIEFKVSCEGAAHYASRIVRLTSPQVFPRSDHPDFQPSPMNSAVDGVRPARAQALSPGSCAVVESNDDFQSLRSFTLCGFVWATTPGDGVQCILGTRCAERGTGVALMLDGEGRPSLWLGQGATSPAIVPGAGPRLQAQRWYFLAASHDAARGRVVVAAIPVDRHHFDSGSPVVVSDRVQAVIAAGDAPLLIGAARSRPASPPSGTTCHFNGRIERPALLGVALDVEDLEGLAAAGPQRPPHPDALGDWDFSLRIGSQRIVDRSTHRRDGILVNLPTRAVTGSAWTGERHDWRAVPGEYGAIHFHDDDLDDARWDTDFVLDVPRDWRSGCYAAHLVAGDAEFWVPFFVRPPRGEEGRRARVAFLVPTCTYAAYANFRSRVVGRWNELYHGRLTVLDRTDWLMQEYPALASSTYDTHRDGSPVVHATMMQPVTNFRPTGRIYKFCQDLLIVDWLEKSDIDYEIVTDDDLHAEGAAALAPYACILSGSHPEYFTTAMLDGLEGFLRAGGRFMYLGGNGFYWRTAFHPTLPGVVEVRRKGQGFLGPTSVPEGQFSFTGEVAGTWLSVGRPPNLICGVGFVTQGFDACEGYRRRPGSRDPRAAFIFDGVTEEVIGDYGMLQGGAAGYEIDRADAALGTPAHALVLASSDNHSNIYEVSASSFMDLLPKQHDDDPDPLRADMVFFETPGGGAVFSVGSIAWCGSLAHNLYRNDVARITGNVLRRFVDPTPFVLPRP